LCIVGLLSLWRVIFLLSHWGDLEISNWGLYLASLPIGLRFDMVVASFGMLPILLGGIFNTSFQPKQVISPRIQRGYVLCCLFAISTISVIDIFYFHEFKTHMNILITQRSVFQIESLFYILGQYHVGLITLGVLVLTGIIAKLYIKTSRAIPASVPGKNKLVAGLIITILLLSVTIRGGWQKNPVDWDEAMFSDNFIANQTAINSIFYLGSSIAELSIESEVRTTLDYGDDSKALAITKNFLADSNSTFTKATGIEREFRTTVPNQYNIVLIVLESFVGEYCGHLNPKGNGVTPNLDKLAENGISFTRCYANGKRSAYGLSSILMSWPALPGLPLISRVDATKDVPSLAKTLKSIGYRTTFLYGGDSNFDNMKTFLGANGFDQITDQHNFPTSTPGTMWGIWDHFVFDELLEVMDSGKGSQFITLFTTTNHQPFEIPPEYDSILPEFSRSLHYEGRVHRTMAYTDHVIGQFMEKASTTDWYNETIFVFIADHSLDIYQEQLEDPRNSHIPFVIYTPGLNIPQAKIQKIVSQVDVVPTILAMIGYPGTYNSFGNNILSNSPAFALRIVNDQCMWFEDDYLYKEILGEGGKLYYIQDLYNAPYITIPSESILFSYYRTGFRSYLETAYHEFSKFSMSNPQEGFFKENWEWDDRIWSEINRIKTLTPSLLHDSVSTVEGSEDRPY